MNKYDISEGTINAYKDNTEILRNLKVRFSSGTCDPHDIELYNRLVEIREKEKKLKLALNIK